MGKPESTVADRTEPQPLLERERELASIEAAIERAARGEGSLLLIEGAAGIGKTRLLAEAKRLAEERGFLVRSARGGELERGMPFGIARQLFEVVIERASDADRERLLTGSAALALTALGRAGIRPASGPGDPFAPIHGLYWLLVNMTEEHPVLLAIDDLHWSDSQTLRYVDYLARRIPDTPALVIANVRLGEPGPPPEFKALHPEAASISPGPLSLAAVAELIADEIGAADPAFAEACAHASAGNPFLVAELMRSIRADGIEPGARAAVAIGALAPESVSRQVLTRLGRFGDQAIAIARAIAVLGGAPQLRQAAILADLGDDQAGAICDELRRAEILAPGLPLDFVHPLVRQAIYRDLPEGERSSLHRRAAQSLHDTGSDPRGIASQLLACAPSGDQWVVETLREAAIGAVGTGALESATAYLERALAEPPDDEVPLRFALGAALLQLKPREAARVLREVAGAAADPWIRFEATRLLAVANFFRGDWEESATSFAEALDVLGDRDPELQLITEAHLYTTVWAARGRSAAYSKRIRAAVGRATTHTAGAALVRQALSFDRLLDDSPVDEVVELAGSVPPEPWDPTTIAPTLGLGIKILTWCGAWDRARDMNRRFLDWAREGGRLAATSYAMTFLSDIDRQSGRLSEAEDGARTALTIAVETSPDENFAIASAAALYAALVARGNLDGAEQLAAEYEMPWAILGHGITPWPLEVRGYLRLAQGDLETGVSDLLEFGEGLNLAFESSSPAIQWRQEVAPALAILGRAVEARQLIATAEQQSRRLGAAHIIGTVLRARGLIEPKEKTIETLRESVRCLEEYGPPHELSRSLHELGSALRRKGSRSEAREPLQRSLELAAKSGAGGLERRAREELAAIGSRPRSAFRTGVASLTASELRVAKLAAEGLNNREIAEHLFVTRRTVETHLTHVYGKLEISGREGLAAALADEPATAP